MLRGSLALLASGLRRSLAAPGLARSLAMKQSSWSQAHPLYRHCQVLIGTDRYYQVLPGTARYFQLLTGTVRY